mmetsp:Transcript_37721/g.94848  ORF Transcript_37721/g.94848 Transcript_37721/m.94848 type:complete len:246 (+) Transcript_37721:551-1288(+)
MAGTPLPPDLQELASIPFAKLLSGPLRACITAQKRSCLYSLNYMKKVGFSSQESENPESWGEPVYVKFGFKSDRPELPGFPSSRLVTIPVLTLFRMPTLRIKNIQLDLKIELHASYTSDLSASSLSNKVSISTANEEGEDESKRKWSTGHLMLGKAADQSSLSTGASQTEKYSYEVTVKATNDAVPPGVERIMTFLLENVKTKDESIDFLKNLVDSGAKQFDTFAASSGSAAPTAPTAPTSAEAI